MILVLMSVHVDRLSKGENVSIFFGSQKNWIDFIFLSELAELRRMD